MGQISSKQNRKNSKRPKTECTQPSVHITTDHLMRKTYPLFAVRQIANAFAARAHSECPTECNPTMSLLYALGTNVHMQIFSTMILFLMKCFICINYILLLFFFVS